MSTPAGTRAAAGLEPLLTARGVGYRYPGGPPVVEGVDLDVWPGDVIGIAGVNGAGKTTLARLLAGHLRPSAGRVLVDGRDTRRERVEELARVVGLVFQDPRTQLFARTVHDELAFGPRNLGLAPAVVEERVAQVAARLGLEDALDASPFSLTGPRRRLVALASVLAMAPRVLVLDEPTAGQDHAVGTQVADLVRTLAAGGTAVICVAHDLPLLAATATRILVLRDGRAVLDGPTRSVLGDGPGLAAAGLTALQVTRLAAAVPSLLGRPAVLTVDELVALLAVRPRSAEAGR